MPVATRDLASFELWEHSLERSQRRRVLAEAARKQLMRRKTASVAMSAAVAAAPMAPSVAAAAALSKDGAAKLARKLERRHVDRVLLERGDSSTAVVELQRALRIPDDGIYGPQTQWAVETFQQREGLDVTGDVNVRTWLKLFPTDAVIYVAPAAAKAVGVDTGDGPSWTAVKASDVAAAQGAPASTAVASGPAPHGHHDASIARAAAALPKHAGKPGHEQPSGGDASSPIGSRPHGPAPAPHANPTPQVNHSPQVDSSPQVSPAPKSEPFTPPSVPGGTAGEIIRELIGAANRIDARHFAYRWGGGHNSAFGGPYDCSGAVSAVLHAAGLLSRPMVSGDFAHWGARGRGAVTIYANAGHVYMSILGRYFGTSSANPGGGAGWFRGGPRPGFAVVHVPFEKLHLKARSATKKRSKAKSHRAHFRRGSSTGGAAADSMSAPSAPAGTTTPASPPPAPQASPAPQAAPVTAQPVTQAQPVRQAQPVAAQPVQQAQPVAAQPVAQAQPGAGQPVAAQPAPVTVQQPAPQAPAAAPAPVQAPANAGAPPAAGTPAAGTGAPPAGEAPGSAAPAEAAQPETSAPTPATTAAPAQPAATPASGQPADAAKSAAPTAGAQEPPSAAPAESSAAGTPAAATTGSGD